MKNSSKHEGKWPKKENLYRTEIKNETKLFGNIWMGEDRKPRLIIKT